MDVAEPEPEPKPEPESEAVVDDENENEDEASLPTVEPGFLDRVIKRMGVERITSKSIPFVQAAAEEAAGPSVTDYVRVQRAYRHQYAVEREGGDAVSAQSR